MFVTQRVCSNTFMQYKMGKQVRIIDQDIVGTISNITAAVGEKTLYGVFANGKIYPNISEDNIALANVRKIVDEKMSSYAKKGRQNLLARLGSPEAITEYFRGIRQKRKPKNI